RQPESRGRSVGVDGDAGAEGGLRSGGRRGPIHQIVDGDAGKRRSGRGGGEEEVGVWPRNSPDVLFVHVASLGDRDDKDGYGLIIDGVDHAQVTDAVAVGTGEFALEGFYVVAAQRVLFKGTKTAGEFFGGGFVAPLVEAASLLGEFDAIHASGPCARAWCGRL